MTSEEEIQQLQTEIEQKKNSIRAQFKKNERKGAIEILIALLQLASIGALFSTFPSLQLGVFFVKLISTEFKKTSL